MRQTAFELVAALVDGGGGDAVTGLSSPLSGLIFGMFIGITPEQARDLNEHSERFESAQFHQRPEIAEEENLYLYARMPRDSSLDETRSSLWILSAKWSAPCLAP